MLQSVTHRVERVRFVFVFAILRQCFWVFVLRFYAFKRVAFSVLLIILLLLFSLFHCCARIFFHPFLFYFKSHKPFTPTNQRSARKYNVGEIKLNTRVHFCVRNVHFKHRTPKKKYTHIKHPFCKNPIQRELERV